MGAPGLHPILETSIRDHPLIMGVPALFSNGVRDCFDQCEPVHISLSKFKVTELVLRREHGSSRNVLPAPEP